MAAAVAADRDEPIQEMNTTPLIDVMLVLLIMFIITIPIQTHSVDVDLPSGGPIVERDRNKIAIEPNGALLWNGASIDMAHLRAALATAAAMDPAPELQVEPHPEARYDLVDGVLAIIKRAEIRSMGFVGNERYASF